MQTECLKIYFIVKLYCSETTTINTDDILNNSDDLPVEYPYAYVIRYKADNGIYDLVDKDNQPVGQVTELTQTGDKPKFCLIWSFKMKDDLIE